MKKFFDLKLFLVSVIFTCVLVFSKTQVDATTLSKNELLKFKNYTIKEDTTIEKISVEFGEPKMVGKSAFGGNSYSYYDDEYTWYLTIETDKAGVIKGYGCINGEFISTNYSYGDQYNGSNTYLGGTILTDYNSNNIIGIYGYNCVSADVNKFWNNFQSHSEYIYDLQKHSVIASKIIATMHGNPFPQTYIDEELFYANEQLKEKGTDLYNYGIENGKSKYISLVSSGTKAFYSDLPNPIMFGKTTDYHIKAENYKYAFYDINIKSIAPIKVTTTILYIDPAFLEEKETIDLTDKEISLLDAVKAQYELYNEHGKAIKKNFDTQPQYKELPLVAGKWSDMALYMVTDYLNIARAGLGISTLTLNPEIADCAQHKAALVYYMNYNGMDTGHMPVQPDGVSDEFYGKAQSYMNENLYHGNIQMSVINALNDGHGDPVSCGHRYNLLDPSYTEWGVGSVGEGISFGWQGVHKFSGHAEYSNELVAWPSNGIFPIDMVSSGIGNWTAQFYKRYKVSNNTSVTVKCLNNGKTYDITKENSAQSQDKFLRVVGTDLISFRDDSIAYESGDVFEITLHNVTDALTGEIIDYSYRSVFLSLNRIAEKKVTDVIVESDSLKLLVGQTQKLNTSVAPEDATNKLVKYTSSNENVATVRQDGVIVAKASGRTTITVQSQSSSKVAKKISVIVKLNESDPDYLKGDLDFNDVINANDAAIALDLYKNGNVTQQDILVADMDGDNVINANDAAIILDIYKNGQ